MSTKEDVAVCKLEIARLHEKVDFLLDVLKHINGRLIEVRGDQLAEGATTKRKASEHVRKIASISYAMAKELERDA